MDEMRAILILTFGLLIASCAPTEPPQTATDTQGEPVARVALVNGHPFDLKRLIEGKGAPHLAGFLRMIDARDVVSIDTNYDKTKSLVTVIGGEYPSGGTLVLDFVQIAGKRSEYSVLTNFGPTSTTSPAVIINAYRIARSANIDVTARIDGKAVASKRFKAEGPADKAQSGYPTLAGDRQLKAGEVRTELGGRKFAMENEGFVEFRDDGVFVRSRPQGVQEGTYEVRNDGLNCTNVKGHGERCYKVVRDARDNLTIINQRSRRYRMEALL